MSRKKRIEKIKKLFFYIIFSFFSLSFTEENLSFTSKIAIGAIKFYQIYISPLYIHSCRFKPSCSNYSIEAIKDYGLSVGLLMTSDRLLRCNPFGDHGVDKPQDHYIFHKDSTYSFEYIDFFNDFLPEIENSNEILGYANKLFIDGSYTEAVKQYNEFLSACPDGYVKNNIFYYLTFIYIKQKNYKVALETIKSIKEYDNIDFLRKNLFIGIVYLAMNKNYLARSFFDKILLLDLQSELVVKIRILKVLSFIEDNKWKEAKEELKKIKLYTEENLLIEEIEEKIDKVNKLKRKLPMLSGLLSFFIPGLGKIYSGKFYDGLFSFFFLSSIGYLCYETYQKEAYLSFSIWSLYFFTFYTGNIYGSIDAARKYNDNIDRDIVKEVKFKIIKILKSK